MTPSFFWRVYITPSLVCLLYIYKKTDWHFNRSTMYLSKSLRHEQTQTELIEGAPNYKTQSRLFSEPYSAENTSICLLYTVLKGGNIKQQNPILFHWFNQTVYSGLCRFGLHYHFSCVCHFVCNMCCRFKNVWVAS